MRKLTAVVLCATLLTASAGCGCSNIQNDRTRTKTEGALTGAGVGTLLGAGIGALAGGGKGALLGGAIGAAAGTGIGYLIGTSVANSKEKYARQEDWYEDCIADARNVNLKTNDYNQRTRQEIASLNQRASQLRSSNAQDQKAIAARNAEKKRVDAKSRELKSNIAALQKRMQDNQKVSANARQRGDTKRAQRLDAENARTKKALQDMRDNQRRLGDVSARLK